MALKKIRQSWEHLGIQKKMMLFFIIISIIPMSVLFIERAYSLEEVIYEEKKLSLKNHSELALSLIDVYYQDFQSGLYETVEDAKLEALTRVSKLRYGVDNLNYFWVFTTYANNTPYRLVHPYFSGINASFQAMELALAAVQEIDEDPNE
jgi:signal transduction histidine kinase